MRSASNGLDTPIAPPDQTAVGLRHRTAVAASNQTVGPFFACQVLGTALTVLLLLALVVQIVDPYGVSPLGLRIERINGFKPGRVDIDRLIKPYEVWAKQPETIFMGTSRIQQSIDPLVLKDSDLWPAYNASVPANDLPRNFRQLRHYLALNPRLKRIYLEAYIYNFMGQSPLLAQKEALLEDQYAILRKTAPLFLSISALRDAIRTIRHNLSRRGQCREIMEGGGLRFPSGHDARNSFATFPAAIWNYYHSDDTPFDGNALVWLESIVLEAKNNDVEVVVLLTPNHAQWDYYHDVANQWELYASLLRRITTIAEVKSFSQSNALVYEDVSMDTEYWRDPNHFTLKMGRMIQLALLGKTVDGMPENFMRTITPEHVDEYIQERKEGVRQWAQDHPRICHAIRQEYARWKQPDLQAKMLLDVRVRPSRIEIIEIPQLTYDFDQSLGNSLGEREYRIVEEHRGSLEQFKHPRKEYRQIVLGGWAASRQGILGLIVTAQNKALAIGRTFHHCENIAGQYSTTQRSGFFLAVTLPEGFDPENGGLQVYALKNDGTAARLGSSLAESSNGVVEDFPAASN